MSLWKTDVFLISCCLWLEDDYCTGCRNVSHCEQQQVYSRLRSPGRWNLTYLWNDSWKPFTNISHNFTVENYLNSFVIICNGHSWSRLKMYVGGLAYETSRLHEIANYHRFLCFIFSYYQHIQFPFKNRVRHWSSSFFCGRRPNSPKLWSMCTSSPFHSWLGKWSWRKTILSISNNCWHFSCPRCVLSVNSVLGRCVTLWNIPIHIEDFHTYSIQQVRQKQETQDSMNWFRSINTAFSI